MFNKKIKLSISLILLLIIISFIGFISVSANQIENDEKYSEIIKELNDALFLDDRQVFMKHIESNFSKELLIMNQNGENHLINELALIKTYELSESYDLLKINKRYDAEIISLYVLFNKNSMKIESFDKNAMIFIDLYKENKIENIDLIADIYTYLLFIDSVDYAKEMMINPNDIYLIYDGDKSKIKYSLRNKYKLNESQNSVLYHYYAEKNIANSVYKYFVLLKKDNIYKIEVNNISSYLYILKDKIEDGNLTEVFNFIYQLNYGKVNDLKLDPLYSKLDKKIKEDLLKNKDKNQYYLSYYKITDNNANSSKNDSIYKDSTIKFNLKLLQHVNLTEYYKDLTFTKIIDDRKNELIMNSSDVNNSNSNNSDEENAASVGYIIAFLFILFLSIIVITLLLTSLNNYDSDSYYSNETYGSIHDSVNTSNNDSSSSNLSRERPINLNQLMENRDNIQASIDRRRNQSNSNQQNNQMEREREINPYASGVRQEVEERRSTYNDYRDSLRGNLTSGYDGRSYGEDLFRGSDSNRPFSVSEYREMINASRNENQRKTQSEQLENLLASINNENNNSSNRNNNISTNTIKNETEIVDLVSKNSKRTISIESDSFEKEEIKINTKRKIYFDEEE